MNDARISNVGQWPPAQVRLAARIFPERADTADSGLDRWVTGWWQGKLRTWYPRQRERIRFRDAVEAEAAGLGLERWDDARLQRESRQAARNAFVGKDFASGALALALVREAARRRLGLLAHPPQLLAAWKLLCGHLIEFDTGEGKTLTAALAACLAALAGVPAHVVTVNDYLAQRDAEKMLPLFAFFGLSVGVVHGGVAQNDRAHQYAQDLTYCTNKDLVFDYLRDRVNAGGINSPAQLAVRRLHQPQRGEERLRLRGLHFAIVDEADSILIDEARTPLILSALSDRGADRDVFAQVLNVAERLQQDLHFRLVGAQRIPELSKEGRLYLAQLAEDYLAEPGSRRKVLDEFWQLDWVREHYVLQALRAIYVYRRDQHYVVLDGKIVIVDEFTGRLLPDRSWEQGLHQLVEVKEGCAATGQNRTLARLTYQVFFGRYLRLAGMSGTLREVAAEMAAVYRVPTLRVEPNRPCQRIERSSLLLRDAEAKHAAIVEEVRQILTQGRAVLIGTRSVMASLAISRALAGAGIVHKVLNALQDEDEASLVAQAGQPGAVTVATNMAGRGTDIPLAPAVAERGGLHVVLSEWHESARIDRQLFGRCARQGDPGSCRAIVALDDELLQHYASALANWTALQWPGSPPASAVKLLRRTMQRKAEAANAAQRRATMRQDRQMRRQLAFSGATE
ncbi:hypothetical protein [Methylomonas sp. DH-1]|uniref:preprotein translocase subunit SecA n=1 Tax=Methylomonas sp. (strain DH-1) TaxID=1727196 RepID=UPI0007C953BA|nr:hypothetical protein [Methylomonas sp. DH-1]ANE55545.1 hypothetical protein AYM39_10385 [Methylomonas sp. DH-1]